MHYPKTTTGTLLDLLAAARNALEIDDALPLSAKLYGVRKYDDWRLQTNAIQAELAVRAVQFQPMNW